MFRCLLTGITNRAVRELQLNNELKEQAVKKHFLAREIITTENTAQASLFGEVFPCPEVIESDAEEDD